MTRKRHKSEVYFVQWADGITKIGSTEHRRYRDFEARGATVKALVEVCHATCMYRAEYAAQAMARFNPATRLAFSSKSEAIDHLGKSGGGWRECWRGVDDIILAAAIEAAEEYECTHVDRAAEYRRLAQQVAKRK